MCLLAGCASKEQVKETAAPAPEYRQISQDTAKEMMERDDGHIISAENKSITNKNAPYLVTNFNAFVILYLHSK